MHHPSCPAIPLRIVLYQEERNGEKMKRVWKIAEIISALIFLHHPIIQGWSYSDSLFFILWPIAETRSRMGVKAVNRYLCSLNNGYVFRDLLFFLWLCSLGVNLWTASTKPLMRISIGESLECNKGMTFLTLNNMIILKQVVLVGF